MHPPMILGHPPLSFLRAVVLVTMMVVTAVLIGFPIGDAIACSIIPTPRVYVSDLASLTDPDAGWKQEYEETFNEPAPNVTGAFRTEVNEIVPETEEDYSGAVWVATNRWGDADPDLIDVREPRSKRFASSCDGNQAPLGASAYFLTTDDDIALPLSVGEDESEADEALDAAFGESEAIGPATESASTRAGNDSAKSGTDLVTSLFRPAWLGLLAALVVVGGSGAAWVTMSRSRR